MKSYPHSRFGNAPVSLFPRLSDPQVSRDANGPPRIDVDARSLGSIAMARRWGHVDDVYMVSYTTYMGISGSNWWRYVSTIFLATFCGDIPLHKPYICLIYGRYLQ